MIARYPIVFEEEETGAVSAYVPDLPVYAAADTAGEAERELRGILARYLADRQARGLALPGSRTVVKVARVSASGHRSKVTIVSPAALLGRQRSAKKAAAARRNGLRGGRPRTVPSGRQPRESRSTHLSVDFLLELAGSGATQDGILARYPQLSAEGLSAAFMFAARRLRRLRNERSWDLPISA
jgi:predicted RNase H-like HicB family nuclease